MELILFVVAFFVGLIVMLIVHIWWIFPVAIGFVFFGRFIVEICDILTKRRHCG
ncbi:MAG: hypothetical protein OXG25_03870 [Gammaproteobacteria bacterium]|nr:hypothetical protein [Gammaproteobacteria bacterium]